MLLVFLLLPMVAEAFTTDQQEDICASANTWVIMCENFENRTVQAFPGNTFPSEFKNLGWCGGTTCSGNTGGLSVINTQAFDGSKSLEMNYPSGANNGLGFASINLPSANRELYFRVYTKHSANYQWSVIADKWLYFNTNTTPNNQLLLEASTQHGIGAPIFWRQESPQYAYAQNINGTAVTTLNEWVCTEVHAKFNTVGNTDGQLELWIKRPSDSSPVQHVSYTNISINSTLSALFNNFMVSGFWNCINNPCSASDSRDVHPNMFVYIDNIVVATQRIGCLGAAPPPDTTPPTIPTGLTLSMIAFLVVSGGFYYGLATPNHLSQHRLLAGHDHAHPEALRTVAVHRSASRNDAEYVVLVEDRQGYAPSRLLDHTPNLPNYENKI